MSYNIYKNCSEEEFRLLKKGLDLLKNKILAIFPNELKNQARADDADHLNLNFGLVSEGHFMGNLSIVFDDLPHLVSFSVSITKAMDANFVRYYKREIIGKCISLELLEKTLEELFKKALQNYYSWSEDLVKNSERTEIERG